MMLNQRQTKLLIANQLLQANQLIRADYLVNFTYTEGVFTEILSKIPEKQGQVHNTIVCIKDDIKKIAACFVEGNCYSLPFVIQVNDFCKKNAEELTEIKQLFNQLLYVIPVTYTKEIKALEVKITQKLLKFKSGFFNLVNVAFEQHDPNMLDKGLVSPTYLYQNLLKLIKVLTANNNSAECLQQIIKLTSAMQFYSDIPFLSIYLTYGQLNVYRNPHNPKQLRNYSQANQLLRQINLLNYLLSLPYLKKISIRI